MEQNMRRTRGARLYTNKSEERLSKNVYENFYQYNFSKNGLGYFFGGEGAGGLKASCFFFGQRRSGATK